MTPVGSKSRTIKCLDWLCYILLTLAVVGGLSSLRAEVTQGVVKGLPIVSFYPFESIGNVSRGAQLSFDAADRLSVLHDGIQFTLNDNEWLETASRDVGDRRAQYIKRDSDGSLYYAALGSWGQLQSVGDGRVQTRSLVPETFPHWLLTSNFFEILCESTCLYFVGTNGVVRRDRVTGATSFLEIPAIEYAFSLEGAIYVSSHARGMLRLELDLAGYEEADRRLFDNHVVDHVAVLGGGRILFSTTGRRLFVSDGRRHWPLEGPLRERLAGRVTAMQALPGGLVALAISGQGLYIISAQGTTTMALRHPDYRSISSLASNGGGVLWAATESGVAKILYGSPVTTFGQSLGLAVGWPQVAEWNGKIVIASNGRIFESVLGEHVGEPVRFQWMPDQPVSGSWAIATWREWLLVANTDGVFARRPNEPFRVVLSSSVAGRLVMLESGVCLVIGEREVAALRFEDGAWRECAERVPGLGYPSLTHASRNAAWVELGANLAGRIGVVGGRITTQVFSEFPWKDPHWVHISVVGDCAVLAGPPGGRLYFREVDGTPMAQPALEKVLAAAPHWVARVKADTSGRLWASHDHGIFAVEPGRSGYRADLESYRVITDAVPLVQFTSGGSVWLSTGRTLYHVAGAQRNELSPIGRPRVLSVRDLRTNDELLHPPLMVGDALSLAYGQNSIAVRFFVGGYGFRRVPAYEYRLNESKWTPLERTSLLRLSDLREGSYQLAVRLLDERGSTSDETAFTFLVAAPWYRSWLAYAAYGTFLFLCIILLGRTLSHRARARAAELERMVALRTEELKVAMEKLSQETRAAATFAERNRLAGEIHDSLEQSFSALLLHLDTIAGLAECPPGIKRGLAYGRSMIAFSRNEVRHAIWGLHSPLLDNNGLETAIRQLLSHSLLDAAHASVLVVGEARAMSSTVEHHLLRIIQEAIANFVKHAKAGSLDIRLIYNQKELRLTISDDGQGFDHRTVMSNPQAGHFGLRSLRGRAAKIGATIDITSAPGEGTRIAVAVPVRSTEAEQIT